MSLRSQVIFRIVLSSLCILLLGGVLTIWQARQAVAREVQASIDLALQFITLGVADGSNLQIGDLSHVRSLKQTRHLSIELHQPDGQLIHLTGDDPPSHPDAMPPAWFIHVVQGDYADVRHQLKLRDGQLLTLVIKARPLDEITEVWKESEVFFVAISLMTILSFFAVNLAFNKSFKAIAIIVEALRAIELGQYRQRLPGFAVAEFDTIAKAVNHMTVEMERAQQENQALAQHSLAIQEDERRRLSQELHDEFGQSLTAIKVMAVTAAHPQADVGKISTTISEICEHLIAVLRSMMRQLHPLMLSELGLKATLEDMVQQWAERNPELTLSIDCAAQVDELDKTMTIHVFRVIQECLTNVVRHAQAQRVEIALTVISASRLPLGQRRLLQLKIQDDGQGCDLSASAQGFGLRGVKERIQSLGGVLNLQSQPGQGLSVVAQIPLS